MIKIIAIADIHFGCRDSDKLYNELKYFIDVCRSEKPDIIVICGDLFHTKLSLNSIHTKYCNKFIYELNQLQSLIILIEGTYSHDNLQVKSFEHYLGKNFRIYNHASVSHYKDYKFLIIPEENIPNSDKYYKELLNPEISYDFVFGHGMFTHAGFYTKFEQGRNKVMFNYKQFINNVKGCVVFGHIHIPSKYKNIIYCGSFTRMNFGEEEDKGFYIFEYSKGKIIREEFIINKNAPKYTSVHMDDIPSDNNDVTIRHLRKLSEENDYLRIIIPDEYDEIHYNNIIGFVKNSTNVSITKSNKKKAKLDKSDIENMDIYNENKKKLDKYKGMSFIEITKKMAMDEYNTEFSTEEINNLINNNE